MNTRQIGNRSENAVGAMLELMGYAVWKSRGSRGTADLVAFRSAQDDRGEMDQPYLPPLVVQVGTQAKPIAATLAELLEAPRPIGSLAIVARKTRMKNGRIKWIFSTQAGRFMSLAEAIESR